MQARRLWLPLSLSLALAAPVIAPHVLAQSATPEATPAMTETAASSVMVTDTYTLPDTPIGAFQNALLPNSIDNDRKMLLGGLGSDLWHGSTDAAGEFWMVTDRGPNGSVTVGDEDRQTFPIAGFDPVIVHVRAADGALTILDAHPILTQSGKPVTGLSNFEKIDLTPYDFSGQTALDFNQNGLDTEGLVRTTQGDFWLVDEYSPSLIHVDATGKVVKRYVPQGMTLDSADYPVSATLPAIYALRKGNRGFEGLGLSADEKTITIVLQSPLSNPDSKTGNPSRNTRVLVFDIPSETVTAEYVYQLDDAVAFGGEGTKPADMKLSAVAVVNPTTLLIDERTDALAKLYTVDLSAATNILGTAWDDAATSPSLEGTADLAAANVTPLPKTLVATVPGFPGAAPGKVEGIAILDPSTVAVANDNDFDIGTFDADGNNVGAGSPSQIQILKLAAPLP